VAAAEQALLGTSGGEEAFAQAAAHCDGIEALSDFHGHAIYRRSIATALVRRALAIAYERASRMENSR